MIPPLELYERIKSSRELVEQRLISILLGSQINSFNDFKSMSSRFQGMVKISGLHYNTDYKDKLYTYKALGQKQYFKIPLLAVARGSVVRVYSNGEAKQTAFPFAKFFNLGETDKTNELPSDNEFIVTEKKDGTLIIVWTDPDTGEIRYNTRGMFDREEIIITKAGAYKKYTPNKISNPYIVRFIKSVERNGLMYELESLVREDRTVMFELVNEEIPASTQVNVYDTPEDSPVWKPFLLAYRDHSTGRIVYDINSPFPRPEFYKVGSMRDVVSLVDSNPDKEGVVVYYPTLTYHPELTWWSYLVKVKNRSYLVKAYIKSGELKWKELALLVIHNKEDDVLPMLQGEYKSFIESYREKYRELLDVWRTFLSESAILYSKRGEKYLNFLGYSLKMRHLVPVVRGYISNPSDSYVESSLRRIVRSYLISKNSKESLLKALERFKKKLNEVLNTVKLEYAKQRSKDLNTV